MGIKKFTNKQLFCLIGLPLVGKSHVGKLLVSRIHSSRYISCGDIARSLIKSKEEQAAMEATDLFRDEIAMRSAIQSAVDGATETCIILDGCPRFDEQAVWMAETFPHLFPTVIEVTAADLPTLAQRAKERARDERDTDQIQFSHRLQLAINNQANIRDVLNKRLIRTYTIVSTADEQSILKQFQRLTKTRS